MGLLLSAVTLSVIFAQDFISLTEQATIPVDLNGAEPQRWA
jgi:hypothetical protein